jgi:hypothetical protein
MRLCIADPPYLGRAEMFYGASSVALMNSNASANIGHTRKADTHPDAHLWDNPETHRLMVERLKKDYDAFAIAMVPSSLRHYLQWFDDDVIIAVWHDPRVMPTGRHPRRRWEPVLVKRAEGRRRTADVISPVGDVLTANNCGGSGGAGFAGAKPRAWTRWVLDMLGYDPEIDTVDDLFHGSGAVAAEVAQGVLL